MYLQRKVYCTFGEPTGKVNSSAATLQIIFFVLHFNCYFSVLTKDLYKF